MLVGITKRLILRAAVLIPIGAVLIWTGLVVLSLVPELTIDNVDELLDDRRYVVLSRFWPIPFGLGVSFLLAAGLLALRSWRMSLIKAANPSAVILEVVVSKKSKKEFAHSAPLLSSGWSHVLMIREDSVSLWSGPPLRQKEYIDAANVRTLEYVDTHERGAVSGGPIILEWTDVLEWKTADTDRRLELVPIGGGPLGNSALPPRMTADAIWRAGALIPTSLTDGNLGGSRGSAQS
ncbi:hypothetical protein SAMN04487846_3428 [Microbacterium sp. cf046]|nr:hypothetical protein SAMN04487846_3428 [Microbacterium sp. cf046]